MTIAWLFTSDDVRILPSSASFTLSHHLYSCRHTSPSSSHYLPARSVHRLHLSSIDRRIGFTTDTVHNPVLHGHFQRGVLGRWGGSGGRAGRPGALLLNNCDTLTRARAGFCFLRLGCSCTNSSYKLTDRTCCAPVPITMGNELWSLFFIFLLRFCFLGESRSAGICLAPSHSAATSVWQTLEISPDCAVSAAGR